MALSVAGSAEAALYGAQPATGNIVEVDPGTGGVLASFDAPDDLGPGHTLVGLTGADHGATLLYANDDGSANGAFFRLDPATGAVLSVSGGDEFDLDGLSFETHTDGTPMVYASHAGVDVHLLFGIGPVEEHYTVGVPQGGLGGDDLGRQFGFYEDGDLHEFPVFSQPPNAFMSSLPAPAADIEGLAFDGVHLYASTASGHLYTLDPDTGAILDASVVTGGALFGLGVAGACGEGAAADDPVACWRLGESPGSATMLDLSGNEHHGEYLGGVTLGRPGVFPDDTAALFDGVDDVARVPDADGLDVGDTFALEAWIKRSSDGRTHQLFNKGRGAYQLVVMNAGAGSQVFLRKAGVTTVARSSIGIPADGEFHHVVASTGEEGFSHIYLDGFDVTWSVNQAQVFQDTAFPLHIGSGASTPATYDELAVYDHGLTAEQVLRHRQAADSPSQGA